MKLLMAHLLFLLTCNAFAQTATKRDSLTVLFEEAVALQRTEKYEEAEQKLLELIKYRPTFVDSAEGSVWYVLGRVLTSQNRSQDAFQAWLKGLQELQNANRFDAFLYSALVDLIIETDRQDYFDLATLTFYRLLDKAQTETERGILSILYEQSEFFLPEKLQKQFEDSLLEDNSHPGRILRQFWRSKDLTPVTIVNERLIEHLRRVEYARRRFPQENVRGFDDRGKIYVRLGQPSAKTSAGTMGLDTSKEQPAVYYFHPHEVWSYQFLDRSVFFPFVDFKDGHGFVLVDRIEKAIPRDAFAQGGTRSQRGSTSRADVRIYFYNQLAKYNPIFYKWAKELEDIKGDPDLAGTDFISSSMPARVKNMKAIYTTTELDFQSEEFRLERTPDIASEVLTEVEDLPALVQTARFLEADGSTRLEIYLGVLKENFMVEALQPLLPIDTLRVDLDLAVEDASYWPLLTKSYRLLELTGDLFSDASDSLLFQAATTTTQNNFFVAGELQSSLAGIGLEDEAEETTSLRKGWREQYSGSGTLLKLTSFRTGLQRSLILEKKGLLMSDVQLSKRIIPDAHEPTPGKGNLYVEPYPFKTVNRMQPLFLYFEIYGLQFSAEGQTKYRIAYEAEQVSREESVLNKIASILGGRKEGRVELDSEYRSDTPNPREWIGLDLQALSEGEIKLTVKVTDQLTDETAERSVSLILY